MPCIKDQLESSKPLYILDLLAKVTPFLETFEYVNIKSTFVII